MLLIDEDLKFVIKNLIDVSIFLFWQTKIKADDWIKIR